MMNQQVINCQQLRERYFIKVLPQHYSHSLDDIGAIRIGKIIVFLFYLIRLLVNLITFNPHFAYFVIMPTGISFYRDCIFVTLLKLFRIRIIYHLRGKGIKAKSANKFVRGIYKWIFKEERIILLSPLLLYDIEDVVHSDQILYVPNGIKEPDDFFIQNRRIHRETPRILYLSNIIETKGPIVLLKACKILKNQGYDFVVTFVGSYSMSITQDRFHKLVMENDLHKNVELPGPKYGDDKAKVIGNSDIFVFPTSNDIWGSVILEAMAYGLPTIATIEGAIPEIIDNEKTGFLVEKNDIRALAEKIAFLIDNPEIGFAMGMAGREKYLRYYTLDTFNEDLLRAFDIITGK